MAFKLSIPLPSAVFSDPAYKSPATPMPPPTRTAPVVVFVAALVSLNVLTPAIVWSPPSLAPATVPLSNSLALSVSRPLPLPVKVLVPMSILPKLLAILPAARAPTVVKLLVTTPVPSAVALSTSVLLTRYTLVLATLILSLNSHAPFVVLYNIV